MSETNNSRNLHTLPAELVYRILDNVDETTILFSFRDVCLRLNQTIDTYDRYKVNSKRINKFNYTDCCLSRSKELVFLYCFL